MKLLEKEMLAVLNLMDVGNFWQGKFQLLMISKLMIQGKSVKRMEGYIENGKTF